MAARGMTRAAAGLLFALALLGHPQPGSGADPAAGSAPAEVISDPFAYCHAARDTGIVGEERTDEAVLSRLVAAMSRHGLVAADAPPEAQRPFRWRCMDGQVWICPLGANLPCDEKANLSREPSEALVKFCRSKPGSAVVPAYVTGRATVYAWACQDAMPGIARQLFTADPAGYLAEFWYQLLPLADSSAPPEPEP